MAAHRRLSALFTCFSGLFTCFSASGVDAECARDNKEDSTSPDLFTCFSSVRETSGVDAELDSTSRDQHRRRSRGWRRLSSALPLPSLCKPWKKEKTKKKKNKCNEEVEEERCTHDAAEFVSSDSSRLLSPSLLPSLSSSSSSSSSPSTSTSLSLAALSEQTPAETFVSQGNSPARGVSWKDLLLLSLSVAVLFDRACAILMVPLFLFCLLGSRRLPEKVGRKSLEEEEEEKRRVVMEEKLSGVTVTPRMTLQLALLSTPK